MTSRSDDINWRDRLDQRDAQDHADNRAHRRLALLRQSGYSEMFFSLDHPGQRAQYDDLIAQLGFYRLPSESVKLEGNIVILFLPDESVKFLGIQAKRNETEEILKDE